MGSWHRRSSTSETLGGQGRSLHEQLDTSQSQTSTSHPPRKRGSRSHCTVVRHADPCSHDRPPFPPKPHQILTTLKPIIPTRAESWRKPRQTLLHPVHFPHVPRHTLDFCRLREKGARMVRRQKKKIAHAQEPSSHLFLIFMLAVSNKSFVKKEWENLGKPSRTDIERHTYFRTLADDRIISAVKKLKLHDSYVSDNITSFLNKYETKQWGNVHVWRGKPSLI